MKKTLQQYPFFLLLLPVYLIVHLESEFQAAIKYDLVYGRIVIIFILPVLLLGIFFLLYRSLPKSSVMTACCLVVLYFAGDLKNSLVIMAPDSIWQSYFFLVPLLFLMLIAVYFIIKKSSAAFKRTFLYLNLLLIFFITIDVARIFINDNTGKYKLAAATDVTVVNNDTISGPDIYYFILDAYTSTKILQKDFNYSNSLMESDLKNKGFRIIPDSRSNYNYTVFSIGSSLNLNYLEDVDTINRITDRTYLRQLSFIYQTKFISFLSQKNYQIFNHSIFDFKSYPSTIHGIDFWGWRNLFDQYNLPLKFINESGYQLPKMIRDISGNEKYDISKPIPKKYHTETGLEHILSSIKHKSSRPKFVYGHFLTTHSPYYFDSLGRDYKFDSVTVHEAYVHRVAYTNGIVKKITDSILAYAERPTAIIICGDHGVSFNDNMGSRNSFVNFSAVYFSNKNYSLFSDSTHSVNTFRILMNTYFNKDYPLLGYKSFLIK
jgi:Sulfatase